MKAESFFENFSLLAETPYGIQKLREMILQMAVQGKLVPQNPEDEPASVLIKRINTEKKRLVKEGLIKSSKPLIPLEAEEAPFSIPSSWEWGRLGDICLQITDGSHSSPPCISQGYPYITVRDVVNDHIDFENCKFIDKESYNKLKKNGCEPQKWDVLFSKDGTVGKVTVVDYDREFVVLSSLAILRADQYSLYPYFFKYLLKAGPILSQAIEFKSGSALKRIVLAKIKLLKIPLPPLEEQKRIVAKVDQLIELCDHLESLQQRKQESHIHLNNATLNKMLDASSPEEFEKHWRLVCDNFGLLYDNLENVEKLKQSILQLAVMGKLVEQDADDEPAEVLLGKIKAEKDKLTKEGKIKKSKSLPSIEKDEIKFDVPNNWMWVRLGTSMTKITDGTHHSPTNSSIGDFKYISAKNIKNEGINLSNVTYVTSEVHNEIYSRCNPEFGDILYIKDGATTGIVTINNLKEPFSMLSSVALLKLPSQIDNRYLLYLLRSPYFYSMMRDDMTGVAITRVTLTKINNAIIPLPPFEEQKRIVAKLNQLMELCDRLEAGIRQAQEDGEKLMEVAVSGLLASCD